MTCPAPAWLPDAIPSTFTNPEGSVVFKGAKLTMIEDGYPILQPETDFIPVATNPIGYEWNIVEARDETGNVSRYAYFPDGENTYGFRFPMASTPVRVLGQIVATEACIRQRAECVVIAEGVVALDASLQLDITPRGKSLGITRASCISPKVDEDECAVYGQRNCRLSKLPGDPSITPTVYEFETAGVIQPLGSGSDRDKLGAAPLKWETVVLADNQSESSGIYQFRGSGCSTSVSAPVDWNLTSRWYGRPVPGKKIEVALVAPKPPVDIEFTIGR
ncbi:MAG: hypothetical protein QM755_21270 [Luteolibacter sp.]